MFQKINKFNFALSFFGLLLSFNIALADDSLVIWISPPTLTSLGNKTFQVDAEATLAQSEQKVLKNAIDYDHYASSKIPSVVESHIVSQTKNSMVVWFHAEVNGIASLYYVQVNIAPLTHESTPNTSTEISWHVIPADPSWPYASNDSVKQLTGDLKLESLGNNQTHITYRTVMTPNTIVPEFMIKMVLTSMLKDEANLLFQMMAE